MARPCHEVSCRQKEDPTPAEAMLELAAIRRGGRAPQPRQGQKSARMQTSAEGQPTPRSPACGQTEEACSPTTETNLELERNKMQPCGSNENDSRTPRSP